MPQFERIMSIMLWIIGMLNPGELEKSKGVNFALSLMVRKVIIFCSLIIVWLGGSAQKIDSICFHLYTDSLKRGFYNYINIDGKTSAGNWLPLDSGKVTLSSSAGYFRGNDLFIDSSYKGNSIVVRAVLPTIPSVRAETIIYIRKRGFEPLKTNGQFFDDDRHRPQRPKRRSV